MHAKKLPFSHRTGQISSFLLHFRINSAFKAPGKRQEQDSPTIAAALAGDKFQLSKLKNLLDRKIGKDV